VEWLFVSNGSISSGASKEERFEDWIHLNVNYDDWQVIDIAE